MPKHSHRDPSLAPRDPRLTQRDPLPTQRDPRLIAWGRSAARSGGLPTLWLFTDSRRLPDPCPAARRLPPWIGGIVFRHDDHPQRGALGRALARICRQRHIALVVAGDTRLALALGAGVHLRGGHWPGPLRCVRLVTSSAHGVADLRRAARAGADLVFLSPAFPTESHPGAPGVGAARWSAMAGRVGIPVAALGGIGGATVRRLPRHRVAGIGAIGALA